MQRGVSSCLTKKEKRNKTTGRVGSYSATECDTQLLRVVGKAAVALAPALLLERRDVAAEHAEALLLIRHNAPAQHFTSVAPERGLA